MIDQTIHCLRLFLGLFREAPPLPSRLLLPGLIALVALAGLGALLPAGERGLALVLAFAIGLTARLGDRIERVAARLVQIHGPLAAAVMVLVGVLGPMALLLSVGEPAWCQRVPSLYYILIGALFLSDVLGQRSEMAALFWPAPEMAPHLAGLTRAMVLYHAAFLLLNETVIRTMSMQGWLAFWAALPVLAHFTISALIATVLDRTDDGTAPR